MPSRGLENRWCGGPERLSKSPIGFIYDQRDAAGAGPESKNPAPASSGYSTPAGYLGVTKGNGAGAVVNERGRAVLDQGKSASPTAQRTAATPDISKPHLMG